MNELAELNWYSNELATFGDRVAAAREAQGLNHKTLAQKLGVSAKTLDAWENDVSEPRANKLQMLSGVLNVSIPWLLTGEGSGSEAEAGAAESADEDIGELMAELRVLRTQIMHAADRIGVLEQRLKSATVPTVV
ncbi:MAG: helix-turn-helix domain-containing protein [Boseongicola sp.]